MKKGIALPVVLIIVAIMAAAGAVIYFQFKPKVGDTTFLPTTDGQMTLNTPNITPASQPRSSAPTTTNFLIISENDTGKSFSFTLLTRAYLRLATRYVWIQPRVSGNAIELIPVNYDKDPGFSEWELIPVRAGKVTIESVGTPNCATGSSCPKNSLEFRMDITIYQ